MAVIEFLSTAILMLLFILAVLHLLNGTFVEWFTGKFKAA